MNKVRRSFMLIEPAVQNRHCTQCETAIPKGVYCLVVSTKNKRLSFCAECMLVITQKLLQHHNVSEIKERVVEGLI